MRNCIIIHGKPSREEYYSDEFPSPSNSHWLPWLQAQLLRNGIATQTPEMLNAWQPDYAIWSAELDRFSLSAETTLVGHSCGAGFIVQYLSEHPEITVDHVVLVAPSFGDTFFPDTPKYDYPLLNGFFEFHIDPELDKRCSQITLFNSDNDSDRVHKTVAHIREVLPSVVCREFHEYDHFTTGPKIQNGIFPELLEVVLAA